MRPQSTQAIAIMIRLTAPHAIAAPDPRLLQAVRLIALIGLTLVLILPGARGRTEWLGWTPLWLAGMPLTAWWALHRFRLPSWPLRAKAALNVRPRRHRHMQARRRPIVGSRIGKLSHAA